MRRALLVVLVVVSLVAGSCGDADEGDAGGVLLASDVDREAPRPDAPVDLLVSGMTEVGFDLYRIASRDADGGNVVLSPASIDVAFTMASAGAVGDTKQELAEVFGLPAEPASHEAQNLLAATLEEIGFEDEETGETVVLDLANSVWGQSGMPFGEPFLDTLATHYGAGLRSIDFGEAEAARSAINGWVSDRTRDRIPDLLSPGFIKPGLTRLVLVNAVYLKATWAEQFATEATTSEAFLRLDGSTVEVPMMNGPAVAGRYATNDGYVAVEVPYSGNDLSMLLIVPDDFATVEQALSSSWLSGLDDQLAAGTIDLSMPRWEIETDLDLGPALTTLGFEIPGGDFSGIAPGLFIDEAIHAANITVDEQGTEAAAATAIGFLESAPLVDVSLRVDRPFLFVVRHDPTGTPLFIGRVTDPTSG